MTTEIALKMLLKLLHLPAFSDNYEEVRIDSLKILLL